MNITSVILQTGCSPISYLLKIYANDKVSARRIALENKEKVSKAISESNKNRNFNSVHLDANEIKTRDRSTNTREQVARKAGVGIRTVARYNKVMNSNDEDIGCIKFIY